LKKELWITEYDPDEMLRLTVALIADEEARWILRAWLSQRLPVIRF
jgi:hypothetical protein